MFGIIASVFSLLCLARPDWPIAVARNARFVWAAPAAGLEDHRGAVSRRFREAMMSSSDKEFHGLLSSGVTGSMNIQQMAEMR